MTRTNSRSKNHAPAVAGIENPPDPATIPGAPSGYIPRPKGSPRERKPMVTQKRAAYGAAQEIRASKTYVQEFGTSAPEQSHLMDALAIAGGWSFAIVQIEEWLRFAKDQEKDAWKHAFPIIDAMRPVFESATARRPELGATYASLARYYGISHEHGKATARGREAAKKAREQKSEDSNTAASTATTDASAVTSSTPTHGAHAPPATTPEAHATVSATSNGTAVKPAAEAA